MGDSLDTDAALTPPLHTRDEPCCRALGQDGLCHWALAGPEAAAMGTAVGAQEKPPAPKPLPKGSSDSCKGDPFLQGRVQNSLCFHNAGAPPSMLSHMPWGRNPPGCACRTEGHSPLLLALGSPLLGLPWDQAPGGFHPSLATSRCCLTLRTSFLSRNSPNEYITLKVTHSSRRHSSRF